MIKRMLVDATHPEEIRVAIVQDQRLIDLDIETSEKEQIKGNIYLAKVTRVEPSLQAAFVDFNGGRQGFLSVNDIHPKYYPKEYLDETPVAVAAVPATPDSGHADGEEGEEPSQAGEERTGQEEDGERRADESEPSFRGHARRRNIPIQKILTRNQVLLVQVVKEARGNKGASLTTNISLAGRYTVLLPENSGGGGISRKIVDAAERKALKELMTSLEVPAHVSLIIRTAGLGRNKREIMRDMSYLLRLWGLIQEKEAASTAPALVHEEGDLIMRTIRDLYTTEMAEILIDGQEAYQRGKDFMRLLMPRYVKVVQLYQERIPIFSRFQIESQIESMHERVVPMRSGGYLVIDPTEALVSIDINSGRSTREKDVESTAFKTNMQAADEIARQLRLRDLGGLVIVDFIDMEDKKHNAEVEKRLKEAFKQDRAKVQIGKISQFGLLELSRQRIKLAFSETNRRVCAHCRGAGTVRSVDSAAIHLLRRIEEDVGGDRYDRLVYHTSTEVANYLFNQKRAQIIRLEEIAGVPILIHADPGMSVAEVRRDHTERPKQARTSAGNEGRRIGFAATSSDSTTLMGSLLDEEPEDEGMEDDWADDDEAGDAPEVGAGPAPVSAGVVQEVDDTPEGETSPAAGPVGTGAEDTVTRRRRRRRRRRRSPDAVSATDSGASSDGLEGTDRVDGDVGDEDDAPAADGSVIGNLVEDSPVAGQDVAAGVELPVGEDAVAPRHNTRRTGTGRTRRGGRGGARRSEGVPETSGDVVAAGAGTEPVVSVGETVESGDAAPATPVVVTGRSGRGRQPARVPVVALEQVSGSMPADAGSVPVGVEVPDGGATTTSERLPRPPRTRGGRRRSSAASQRSIGSDGDANVVSDVGLETGGGGATGKGAAAPVHVVAPPVAAALPVPEPVPAAAADPAGAPAVTDSGPVRRESRLQRQRVVNRRGGGGGLHIVVTRRPAGTPLPGAGGTEPVPGGDVPDGES